MKKIDIRKSNCIKRGFMEEKLIKLYDECIKELQSIKINVIDNELIGKIDIKLTKRNSKRYGCCKQEEPIKECYHITKIGRRKIKKYDAFKKHHIEISKWVMNLDESIIKNTIMHEIIHCFPYCNNHGKEFKKYVAYINQNLGYNITRLGNKEEDFKKSNLEYKENTNSYKYRIICNKCGQIIYRQRFKKELINKYRCGKCGGTLKFDLIY